MCDPTWPTTIGKQAFQDYATERGWSGEQVAKAWNWCTDRQHKINIERRLAAERERAMASTTPPKAACTCSCPSCRAPS